MFAFYQWDTRKKPTKKKRKKRSKDAQKGWDEFQLLWIIKVLVLI